MAENLLEKMDNVEEAIVNTVATAQKEIEGAVQTSGTDICNEISILSQDLHSILNTLLKKLNGIETFLGISEDSENGAKVKVKVKVKTKRKASEDEDEDEDIIEAKPKRFRIKGWDGNDMYWYGGRSANKTMWHKTVSTAKQFDTREGAEDIASQLEEGDCKDRIKIEEVK